VAGRLMMQPVYHSFANNPSVPGLTFRATNGHRFTRRWHAVSHRRAILFFMVVRSERLVMRTKWKEISKFLAGAFFVTAGASWYFWWQHVSVPFPFFGFTSMTPEFLGLRGFLHFALFLISFYFGFFEK